MSMLTDVQAVKGRFHWATSPPGARLEATSRSAPTHPISMRHLRAAVPLLAMLPQAGPPGRGLPLKGVADPEPRRSAQGLGFSAHVLRVL